MTRCRIRGCTSGKEGRNVIGVEVEGQAFDVPVCDDCYEPLKPDVRRLSLADQVDEEQRKVERHWWDYG